MRKERWSLTVIKKGDFSSAFSLKLEQTDMFGAFKALEQYLFICLHQ